MGDAAAVESHRLEGALRWRCFIAAAAQHVGLDGLRSVRAQYRAVEAEERDMVGDSLLACVLDIYCRGVFFEES